MISDNAIPETTIPPTFFRGRAGMARVVLECAGVLFLNRAFFISSGTYAYAFRYNSASNVLSSRFFTIRVVRKSLSLILSFNAKQNEAPHPCARNSLLLSRARESRFGGRGTSRAKNGSIRPSLKSQIRWLGTRRC